MKTCKYSPAAGRGMSAAVMMAVGCLMALSACRPPVEKPSGPSRAPAPSATTTPAPRPGEGMEPGFHPDQVRGSVVLVDFWAPWTHADEQNIEALNRLYDRYQERGFTIVGLAVDRRSPDQIRSSLAEAGARYPVAPAGESDFRTFGDIRALPTRFLLDRDGNVIERLEGHVPMTELEAHIATALGQ